MSARQALPMRASWVSLILVVSAVPITASCRKRAPSESKTVKAAPASGPSSREAREQAVFALIEGEVTAASLPEMASEPGEALDPGLRDRLDRYEFETDSSPSSLVHVTVGAVQAPETMAEADRIIAGMRAGFRACYKQALDATPALAGVLNVKLRVNAAGAIASVSVAPNAAFSARLVTCIEQRARASKFEPLRGMSHAEIRFTVTLAPA